MSHCLRLLLALLIVAPLHSQERMSPELLWRLGRIGGAVFSPEGDQILYSLRHYSIEDNGGDSDLFIQSTKGGKAQRITARSSSEYAYHWVETKKGARIFFIARRDDVETPQVYSMKPDGSDVIQVTGVSEGVANLKVSPDGRRIAFTVDIKLDDTVNDLHDDLPYADARIIDSLMYRHWDRWHDYAYSHLWVAELDEEGVARDERDLMEGLRVDCPVPPFGGSEQFAWSPDGNEIAYSAKIARDWAQSTDTNVYLVDVREKKPRARCITTGMKGYDQEPAYSPDGRFIAFHSMERASFESDRNRIMLFDRKKETIREITGGLDQTTHGASWSPDSAFVYFKSERLGTDQLFRIHAASGEFETLSKGRFNYRIDDISPDGRWLLVGRQSMLRPWELGLMPAEGGDWRAISDVNGEIFAKLELPKIEERWTRSSDGAKVHSWVIYPPNFDPKKRYPMITYCQGGPQGQIGQWFSYRWNFHLMAAQGYIVLAVNRRGLPGFGRAWNDEISRDWGGQAMKDILAATDGMLTEPYVDRDRVAAVGASFGGYTVYWLMGNHEDRFCTMISHAGLFNLESFYGATEELFFPNWDVGGPYWKSKELQADYDRFSPHRYVANWKTPLLVIHGELDFRVPIGEAFQAFQAAKLQGCPTRFLYFPGEGHWVQSPQNGVLWHRVFFDWLARSCRPEKD